jgi:hypothetical protein
MAAAFEHLGFRLAFQDESIYRAALILLLLIGMPSGTPAGDAGADASGGNGDPNSAISRDIGNL